VQGDFSCISVRAVNAWPARDPPACGEPAFDELVRIHRRSLERFTHGLGASREDAEEIASTALLRAYQSPPERGGREWGPWLRTVARNLWIDTQRRRVLRVVPDDGVLEQLRSGEPAVDQIAATAAEARELCEVIALLPKPQRAAVYLREVRGLSYDEIARELGMTVPTVTSTLHRARQSIWKRGSLGSAMGIVFTPLFVLRRLPAVARLVTVSSAGAKVAVPITLAATLGTATVIVHQQTAAGLRPPATPALHAVAPTRQAHVDRNRRSPAALHPARVAAAPATRAASRASSRRPTAHRSSGHPSGQPLRREPYEPSPNPPAPRPVDPAPRSVDPATVAESTRAPATTVTPLPVPPSDDAPPRDAESTPAPAMPATRPPAGATVPKDGAGRAPVVSGKAASTTGAEHRARGQARGTPPASATAAGRPHDASLARPTGGSPPPSVSTSARVPAMGEPANSNPRAPAATPPPTTVAGATAAPVASAGAGDAATPTPSSPASAAKPADQGPSATPPTAAATPAGAAAGGAAGAVPGAGSGPGGAGSQRQDHGADVARVHEGSP
jgi:RNA polymerase sigma factor (sigma-70 family)